MGRALGLDQCPVFVEKGDAYVTTEFGKDIPNYPTTGKTGDHWGLDIVRRVNNSNTTATVCALADGIIYAQRKYVKDGEKTPSGGNCVYIRHSNGKVTKYLHFKQDSVPSWVKDNVPVKKGQTIGYMGNTGNSYGAHLHFQVEDKDGNPIDPEPYLTGKKIIDKDEDLYEVHIGEFKTEAAAKSIQSALKVLGTQSTIVKK